MKYYKQFQLPVNGIFYSLSTECLKEKKHFWNYGSRCSNTLNIGCDARGGPMPEVPCIFLHFLWIRNKQYKIINSFLKPVLSLN